MGASRWVGNRRGASLGSARYTLPPRQRFTAFIAFFDGDICGAAFSLTMTFNAESALAVAKTFLRNSGIQTFWLQSVRRDQKAGQWRVVVRIGSFIGPLKEVIVDETSREVISYGDANPFPRPP